MDTDIFTRMFTSVLAISGDIGWEPPNVRQKRQMLRLWNRLVKMSDQRITEKVFNWDILHGHPWADVLKSLFYMNECQGNFTC